MWAVLPFAWALFGAASLTAAGGTLIPITLYTDNNCASPSTTATNISLELGVCAVTPGLGAFDLQPFPCASGTVANYAFSDTVCGQTATYFRGGNDGHCYGQISGDLASILLSCDETEPGPVIGTTTIVVGPVATSALASSSLTSSSSSSSSSTSSTSPGSTSSSSSSSSTPSTSPTPSGSGWSSLDPGVRIGIIVALAVGIPPILIGLYMIQLKRRKEREREQKDGHGHGHGHGHAPAHPPAHPPAHLQPGFLMGSYPPVHHGNHSAGAPSHDAAAAARTQQHQQMPQGSPPVWSGEQHYANAGRYA